MTIDPSVLAAALVLVIGALTTATIAIMKQQAASRLEMLNATNALHTKIDVVEHATNGIATRNAAIITSQEIQLGMLRETIAKMESTAILLAQSKAIHPAPESAAIAENTALTREIRDAIVSKVEP